MLRAVQSVNPNKATGFYLIRPRVSTSVSEEITTPLKAIFKQVKKESVNGPRNGKKGEWVPVHKKKIRSTQFS